MEPGLGLDTTTLNIKKCFGKMSIYSKQHLSKARASSDCNGIRNHNHLIRERTLNLLVFVYELCGCGFESRWSHLNFRYRTCFEQGVP